MITLFQVFHQILLKHGQSRSSCESIFKDDQNKADWKYSQLQGVTQTASQIRSSWLKTYNLFTLSNIMLYGYVPTRSPRSIEVFRRMDVVEVTLSLKCTKNEWLLLASLNLESI